MSIIDSIKNLTFGKGVSIQKYDEVRKKDGMTDEKIVKIAAQDGNPNELSLEDLKAYEDGLVQFEDEPDEYQVLEQEIDTNTAENINNEEVEVPKKIEDLVAGIEEALNQDWTVNVTDVEKLIKNASADQMYLLDNYWNETKGIGISEQIQNSLGIKEDDKIIGSINEKIAKGLDRANAQLKKTYKEMPKASRDAADTLKELLIDNGQALTSDQVSEVYDTILELYNEKTTQLDEYWQMAYGKTLAETISENDSFEGQDAKDMLAVINARITNPTHTRSKEEMEALKTRLDELLEYGYFDRDVLAELLIDENVSRNAMEALDKRSKDKFGMSLAAAIQTYCSTSDSHVIKGWLENYGIEISPSKETQATGEALAKALGKVEGSAFDTDAIYGILGNYKSMDKEALIDLNDYWVQNYDCSLLDEIDANFTGQERDDLMTALQAKLGGKSVTRTLEQMGELKTSLEEAINSKDKDKIVEILIKENVSKNAMEALDKYCKKTYGNESLIDKLTNEGLASDAMVKWLESYGLKGATASASATPEATASAATPVDATASAAAPVDAAAPDAALNDAEPVVEVPKKIKGLVEGVEGAIDSEANFGTDVEKLKKLIKNATPEQMYALDNYWKEAKGIGISAQMQESLQDMPEKDNIITSIEDKIGTAINNAYKEMPKASRDAADDLSALLIDNENELTIQDIRTIYNTILKLPSDKIKELDEYWQKAYGKRLTETLEGNSSFDEQSGKDIKKVIDARLNNPTRTRSKEEMEALKTRLEEILTTKPVDIDALSTLLISENMSKQAMEALDKRCRQKLETSLAAAVYLNLDYQDSYVIKGWLENYGIEISPSKKTQERGEALAKALGKVEGSEFDKDAVYTILGNYKSMDKEELLELNDYWAKNYGYSLVDEIYYCNPDFANQEGDDLIAAIKAKLSGKSVTRTQEQMGELKTKLKDAIETENTEDLTKILIGENISKNAMEALDKYCKKTYGNKSLIEVLKEQGLASDALIKWLESYGLK